MGKNWSGNNRAGWHDYRQRQIYHITLKKRTEIPPFGRLAGDWRLPAGSYGRSYIVASSLGKVIKACLREMSSIHPALRVYQYALMPDHLHIILSVEAPLDEVLGRKLAAFKVLVNKRANSEGIFKGTNSEGIFKKDNSEGIFKGTNSEGIFKGTNSEGIFKGTNSEGVFERGFNDQILTVSRSLDTIFSYLRDNPYRLAVRFANPGYFSRVNQLTIDGKRYAVYGNFHLLDNPFKEQVVVHSADSAEKRSADRQRWLHTGANGGVLVSPFISPAERAVRMEAESLGARIILIVHELFPERYKPYAHDFDLCAEGRLLIISLGLPAGTTLLRQHCLQMNALASLIADKTYNHNN